MMTYEALLRLLMKVIAALISSLLPYVLVAQPMANYQSILDSIYAAHPEANGILVHLESPSMDLSWSGGVGYSDKDNKILLTPDQPALIASSIKPYVAATILRLQEIGKLTIEDPISNYLTKKTTQLFEDDGYDFDAIRLKHLLSHTSGIDNYFNDEQFDWIDKNQQYRWTRDEQLALSVKVVDPLGGPADVFKYTDINFLLCTEIIEQVWGQPFYTSMRELLRYEQLGLEHTWFPTLEDANPETKTLVHQYWAERNWDSYKHDISWDLYGGGGIATTTKELALFAYSLFHGEIIENSNVLNQIFTKVKTNDGESISYCLGLSEWDNLGYRAYGHGGFWGTAMSYYPELDLSCSVYVLDRSAGKLRKNIADAIVTEVAQAKPKYERHLFRPEYELYSVENSIATLVLFPGGGSTAVEIRKEFDILETAQQNGVSVLMMNFNRHLWIDDEVTAELSDALVEVFEEYQLPMDAVYLGGMSLGGNNAMRVSNHLVESNAMLQPEGVFAIDSPLDLYALHQSCVKDTLNTDLDEERLAEPRMIANYLEGTFGKDENLLIGLQAVSPFTLECQHNNVPALSQTKVRFYTEPDAEWWMDYRKTDYESTNAYMLQQISKLLKDKQWKRFELIETQGKGYRSDGERHPHSWSIVDIDDLIKWIKE